MARNAEEVPSEDEGTESEAMADQARRRLALFLDEPRERIDEDVAGALLRALERLPSRGPLRRDRDGTVLEAIRTLLGEFPKEDPRRIEIQLRLSKSSRQAAARNWPPEVWRR